LSVGLFAGSAGFFWVYIGPFPKSLGLFSVRDCDVSRMVCGGRQRRGGKGGGGDVWIEEECKTLRRCNVPLALRRALGSTKRATDSVKKYLYTLKTALDSLERALDPLKKSL